MCSMIHWFMDSLIHWFIGSLIPWVSGSWERSAKLRAQSFAVRRQCVLLWLCLCGCLSSVWPRVPLYLCCARVPACDLCPHHANFSSHHCVFPRVMNCWTQNWTGHEDKQSIVWCVTYCLRQPFFYRLVMLKQLEFGCIDRGLILYIYIHICMMSCTKLSYMDFTEGRYRCCPCGFGGTLICIKSLNQENFQLQINTCKACLIFYFPCSLARFIVV